jgi:DNA repair protein RecO (recombination protein O)
MSEIVKAKAVILSKLNYGDTSIILNLFTEEAGKLTAILKGARTAKSKTGTLADILNYVDVVFYKKESREIQLITQIELLNYFKNIRENIRTLTYASSVIELVNKLTAENESNKRLFRGIVRILNLMNNKDSDVQLLFVKFFIFFLKEIGYELQIDKCSICKGKINIYSPVAYSSLEGILCDNCSESIVGLHILDKELLKIFNGINDKFENLDYTKPALSRLIRFLENYTIYQIPEFKGVKSLKLLE